MYATIVQRIHANKDCSPQDNARYHKTGPGQYAEHEQFYGIRAGTLRRIAAKTYADTHYQDLDQLLQSPYNEFRLLATMILVMQFRKSTQQETRTSIYRYYLAQLNRINNWNLVDNSAHWIIGDYLWQKDRIVLFDLAKHTSQWPRRVAIVSTFYFIKKHDLNTTFQLAEYLLNDTEDLMHKAIGWMLRETGKINKSALSQFLYTHYHRIARTTLRYAIEHFPHEQRQAWLKGPQG
tara:strand:+ start:35 stop:742 length:708 start_codon:yes stop_codon:yes gene_type:complete